MIMYYDLLLSTWINRLRGTKDKENLEFLYTRCSLYITMLHETNRITKEYSEDLQNVVHRAYNFKLKEELL